MGNGNCFESFRNILVISVFVRKYLRFILHWKNNFVAIGKIKVDYI